MQSIKYGNMNEKVIENDSIQDSKSNVCHIHSYQSTTFSEMSSETPVRLLYSDNKLKSKLKAK